MQFQNRSQFKAMAIANELRMGLTALQSECLQKEDSPVHQYAVSTKCQPKNHRKEISEKFV